MYSKSPVGSTSPPTRVVGRAEGDWRPHMSLAYFRDMSPRPTIRRSAPGDAGCGNETRKTNIRWTKCSDETHGRSTPLFLMEYEGNAPIVLRNPLAYHTEKKTFWDSWFHRKFPSVCNASSKCPILRLRRAREQRPKRSIEVSITAAFTLSYNPRIPY